MIGKFHRLIFLIAAWLSVVGLPQKSSAEATFVPQPGFLPTIWSADISGDQNEIQFRQLPCTINGLRFSFRIENTNLDPNGRMMPTIHIRIGTGDLMALSAPDAESATFVIQPHSDGTPSELRFFKTMGDTASDVTDFGTLPLGEDATLSLSWTGQNAVTARFNDAESATVTLGRVPDSLLLGASGVKAAFHDIQAGSVDGAAAKTCLPSTQRAAP